MRVAIGSDHGGFELKGLLTEHLKSRGVQVLDAGCHSRESVDYPDYAGKVAGMVVSGDAELGVMIDGAGVGSCMVANKFSGVRAALCNDIYTAGNAREHNNANYLTMGSMVVGPGKAKQILDVFLDTAFGGGRHQRRVDKIDQLDRKSAVPGMLPYASIEEMVQSIISKIGFAGKSNTPDPVPVPSTSENLQGKRVITEEDLRKIKMKGGSSIHADAGALITPLARDYARDHKIRIIR